jgi:hypothetical protein
VVDVWGMLENAPISPTRIMWMDDEFINDSHSGSTGIQVMDPSARHRHSRSTTKAPTSLRRSARCRSAVKTPSRVLICYDFEEDDTLPAVRTSQTLYGP